jgi:uncharacterized protein YggE
VTTVAETAGAALDENGAAMRKVFEALTQRGIAERDRQTTTLNLYPVYERSERQQDRPKIIGYRAENGLRVTVRNIEQLGEVLDDLVTRGANQLQGVSFSVAEDEALTDQARRLAMADAARKANLYAEEAGVVLGPVIGIDERGTIVPQPRAFQAARVMAAEAVPVAPGEQDFSVELVVRYAIQ